MAKILVIVESPAKSKTIHNFLGSGYVIKSSMGHVIDLPKSKIGIDIANSFETEYVVIRGKGKILKNLVAASKKVDTVYLAMDLDREGESIAWHLANHLRKTFKGSIRRITFNEITRRAILKAVSAPRDIDEDLVNAQQARRCLDRIVGYKVSPFLWKSVSRGLSAGRVQSVCVRLVCEREELIKAFVSEEWWSVEGLFLKQKDTTAFLAKLEKKDDQKIALKTEKEATAVLEDLKGASYTVTEVKTKERRRYPDPPFVTSSLQQRAAYTLGFTASKTMMVAQQLYEGVDLGNGQVSALITYMRTDSYRLSAEAQKAARMYIEEHFGAQFLPKTAPVYSKKKKTKSNKKSVEIQDAHEAIRPISVDISPESLKKILNPNQYSLYCLIWKQFLKSQMTNALFDVTTAKIEANNYLFKASGSVVKDPGFMVVEKDFVSDVEREDQSRSNEIAEMKLLPPLEKGELLKNKDLKKEQHFTKPPPRYSEASLVKDLEEYGIGRPSTYAPTIKTIQDRGYVEKIERRFHPTLLGTRVNEILLMFMPDIFNVDFTAQMEKDLDEVADGSKNRLDLLRSFYDSFEKNLEIAEKKTLEIKKQVIETDKICEKCQAKMVVKVTAYGSFLACSGYPECRHTMDLDEDKGEKEDYGEAPSCEKCSSEMVIMRGRFGKFWACPSYPDCKQTRQILVKSGVACPEKDCSGELVRRKSKKTKRTFWGCSRYPDCRYLTNKLEDLKTPKS